MLNQGMKLLGSTVYTHRDNLILSHAALLRNINLAYLPLYIPELAGNAFYHYGKQGMTF